MIHNLCLCCWVPFSTNGKRGGKFCAFWLKGRFQVDAHYEFSPPLRLLDSAQPPEIPWFGAGFPGVGPRGAGGNCKRSSSKICSQKKTSPDILPRVKLSIYASTDYQLSGDDLLIEQRLVTLPVGLNSSEGKIDFKFEFDTLNGALASGSYYLIASVEGRQG